MGERELLKEGQTLRLAWEPEGKATEVYRIRRVAGEGGFVVCYEAVRQRDGRSGMLKEFYPKEMTPGYGSEACLRRMADGTLKLCAASEDEAGTGDGGGPQDTPDGNLSQAPVAGRERYERLREEYRATYEMLNAEIAADTDNEVLKNYLQIGDLLYGGPDAVLYVWSAGLVGVNFADYLCGLRKEMKERDASLPGGERDRRIHEILEIVTALTDGICAQHRAGILHLDIKPSNFLVPYDSEHHLLTGIVAIYDIHSLRRVEDAYAVVHVSAGCSAPEVRRSAGLYQDPYAFRAWGRVTNRADIYSIGALLFSALVIHPEVPDGLYDDGYYNRIDRLLASSALFAGSAAASDETLMELLGEIFKKCLAPNQNLRYASAGKLRTALKKAVLYAGQYAASSALLGQNRRLVIEEANERAAADPTLAVQKLLFEHPLYEALPAGKKEIDILVAGSGIFGRRFMDICLQVGQMVGYTLRITAVSDHPGQDRKRYLAKRPDIARFVKIGGEEGAEAEADGGKEPEGSLSGDGTSDDQTLYEPYGRLDFMSLARAAGGRDAGTDLPAAFYREDGGENDDKNRRLIHAILKAAADRGCAYQYCFVALGEDSLNRHVARLLWEEEGALGEKVRCPVAYVCEGYREEGVINRTDVSDGTADALLRPVCVDHKLSASSIRPELNEMAFRADLAWNTSLNLDLKEARETFLADRYRYTSSVQYALSIRYKLYGIGILFAEDAEKIRRHQGRASSRAAGQRTGAQGGNAGTNVFRIVADEQEAAELFTREILGKRSSDPGARQRFDALVALEHRRWVLEKVAEGWTAPIGKDGSLNLESCADAGAAKNAANHTHACLLPSTATSPLKKEAYQSGRRAKWEEVPIDPALDPLDRMSVELHQIFKRRAGRLKETNPLHHGAVKEIGDAIPKEAVTLQRGYREYLFCLRNILEGNESYSRQYDVCASAFAAAVSEADHTGVLPRETADEIRGLLSKVREAFHPAVEANLYRDYKANDETLIEKLPFILAYHFPGALAMAFEDGRRLSGRNEAVFTDVASATLLVPGRIYYLYYFDHDSDPQFFSDKLSCVLRYLGRRQVRCEVRLGIAFADQIQTAEKQKLGGLLDVLIQKAAGKAVLKEYTFLGTDTVDMAASVKMPGVVTAVSDTGDALVDTPQDPAALFMGYLRSAGDLLYDGSTQPFASALENAGLLAEIRAAGLPYFELDWRRKRFHNCRGCGYLRYLKEDSFLRIQDMFALMNAESTGMNSPDFEEEYETAWEIYTGNYRCYGTKTARFTHAIPVWNKLCLALKQYDEEGKDRQIIGKFCIPEYVPALTQECVFRLPESSLRSVRQILKRLGDYGIVGDVVVSGRDGETYTLRFRMREEDRQAFTRLLVGNEEALRQSAGVEILTEPDPDADGEPCLIIRSCDLSVRDARIRLWERGEPSYTYNVLRKLEDAAFIKRLWIDEKGGRVTFDYASQKIKDMLTNAGRILEYYTYYETLKLGYFDDVAWSYEFAWEKGEVKNELDLVLTKGFRSMIVECKAVRRLEQGYYHKLDSLAEHFGVGTIKVLVANTYTLDEEQQLLNDMQRSRGSQLHIHTLSGERDIRGIGLRLKELMEDALEGRE